MLIRATINFITRTFNKTIVRSFVQHNPQSVYAERPFVNQSWLTDKATLKDALHNSWLMAKGVIPFNYDSYEWACNKSIHHQVQLTK